MYHLKSISKEKNEWKMSIFSDEWDFRSFKAPTLTALVFRVKQSLEWKEHNIYL